MRDASLAALDLHGGVVHIGACRGVHLAGFNADALHGELLENDLGGIGDELLHQLVALGLGQFDVEGKAIGVGGGTGGDARQGFGVGIGDS